MVMAATVGLLTCPEECLSGALARCDSLFDSNVLYSAGKPSVAVRGAEGVTPLREWVMRQRADGLLACRAEFGGRDDGDDNVDAEGSDAADSKDDDSEDAEENQAHKMAGFLGGRPDTLHLRHAGRWHSYRAGTVSSPVHAMTVAQFAELIDAQVHPAFYWRNILAAINQFHACNGIAAVEPDAFADFLPSAAAAHAWNVTGDLMMREMQVEALTFDEAFSIPAHLAHLVDKVTPFHDWDRTVWLDAYDEDTVTGHQLYQLIMAQTFHAEIWLQCADPLQLAQTLGEDYDLSDFPHLHAGRWGHYLQGLDANNAELVRDDLLELLRLECRRRDCEPVIPVALEDIFGPDDEERRRLAFRAHLQHDMGWRLQRNPTPWSMFVFDEDNAAVAGDKDVANVDHQQRFEAALAAIEAFSMQARLPFTGHFRLARALAAAARTDGPVDRAAFERICVSNGASGRLADPALVDLCAAFGWRSRRVLGLAAVSAADVFGAMGSWNDQSFDDDEEARFNAVSAELFSAMSGYLASLLTVQVRDAPGVMTPVQYLARRLWRLMPGAA